MNAVKAEQHKILHIGDVNVAPRGGLWGYSASSKLKTIDADFDLWVGVQQCREIIIWNLAKIRYRVSDLRYPYILIYDPISGLFLKTYNIGVPPI